MNDSRGNSSEETAAVNPVNHRNELATSNAAPVHNSLPETDHSENNGCSSVPVVNSSLKLPGNESLTDEDEVEPGWVWTEPNEDDIKHYLEFMRSLKESEENLSKKELVTRIFTAQ